MNENISSAREIIERLVKQSGITKKLAAEIVHAIPFIIEEGLKIDGEVRVKGFGTFRLRWTRGRMGRNPKTGERVEIPSHNRVVFRPEQSFKEYINRDYRLLSYKIIPPAEKVPSIDESIPEPEPEHALPPQYTEPEQEPVRQFQQHLLPEQEPESPTAKRRVHWIIPAAVSLVIILSLIFYLRNFYHKEDRTQKSTIDNRQLTIDNPKPVEVLSQSGEGAASDSSGAERRPDLGGISGQQSAVSSQQSAVSGQKSAVSGQQSAVSSQQSAVSSQQSAVSGQKSAVSGQQVAEPIQNSELRTVTEGNHLFRLARDIYGNPYLWVLIYKENLDKIPDPDMLISGRELVIPVLEGTPGKLTRNDSLAVSQGYRLVYEYFKAKDDPRTNDFFRATNRYKPK